MTPLYIDDPNSFKLSDESSFKGWWIFSTYQKQNFGVKFF